MVLIDNREDNVQKVSISLCFPGLRYKEGQ